MKTKQNKAQRRISNVGVFVTIVQSLSHVQLFATSWTAACQTPLSLTIYWSFLNSCPLSWCFHHHLTLPSTFSSIKAFSSVRASASTSVLPMNKQHWFPLGVTSLIPMLSKGLIRVFYSITFQTQFSSVLRHFLWSNSNNHT